MMLVTNLSAQAIDNMLAETFPASDPPAWTPGIVRPAPEAPTRRHHPGDAAEATGDRPASDVIDVSRSTTSDRTFLQAVGSLFAAAGLSVLVPAALFAFGAAVALGIRGWIDAAGWLLAIPSKLRMSTF
jgi:hypothetical protein